MIRHYVRTLAGVIVGLLSAGCLGPTRVDLAPRTGGSAALVGQFRAYDGHDGRRLDFADVVARCRTADVILFGEQHNDAVCNQFEAQLLYALARQPRPVALAMEFFEADTQAALDAYLRRRIDEEPFREQTRQGRAYVLSHRPLIELCRLVHVPVIAANAPRRLVRAYRNSGLDYEEFRAGLEPADQRWLPTENAYISGDYQERFFETMKGHGGPPAATQPASGPSSQPTTAEAAVPPGMPRGMPPGMPGMPPTAMPRGMPPMPPPSMPPSSMPTTMPGVTAVSAVPPASMPTTAGTAVPPTMPAMPRIDPAAMYQAQLLWDQTMAESLASFRARYTTHRAMLIVGGFHVMHNGGTAIKFHELRPTDRILTIVYSSTTDGRLPFSEEDRDAGDIVIVGVAPPPEEEKPAPPMPSTMPAATQPTASMPTTTSAPTTEPAPAHLTPASTPPTLRVGETVIRDVLVIGGVGRWGRSAVHTDAIEAEIIAGRWSPPAAGQTLTLPDGSVQSWAAVSAGPDGMIRVGALMGGYAYAAVESDRETVMLLEASGQSMVYANGEPRAGDPYQWGFVRLPVLLKAGTNQFLFACGRGEFRAKLIEPRAPIMLDTGDATLPDLIRGAQQTVWGAVPVVNATTTPQRDLVIRATYRGQTWVSAGLPVIPALSVRKVGFQLPPPPCETPSEVALTLDLFSPGRSDSEGLLDTRQVKLAVRASSERHKRTFVSEIDGSVQYYAVVPADTREGDPRHPALVLTLHGAGVEATGQADSYSQKTWAHIVAPTNRRPYGFDWEDWGRLDVLEVLRDLPLPWDPQRFYLTGHSMGGHGVWQVGVTLPDLFAAIGPSAGWLDFWSYAGAESFKDPTPIEQLLERAVSPSRTRTLARNTLHYGVYILHGEADDNVPVDQARTMKTELEGFHPDLAYHEQPGAGHWWDASPAPGVDCVDWAPLFEFFQAHVRPATESVRHIEFHTANPAISASSHWVTIEAQTQQLVPSSVDITFDPDARTIAGRTENVARLSLDLDALNRQAAASLHVQLDGQALPDVPSLARVWLSREGETWTVSEPPAPGLKGPHRSGPFKQAFTDRFVFVYGTQGTAAENTVACNKARYDAEVFWVRGNGSVDVLADRDFDPSAEPDRNVILYGDAETNAAWKALLADCPIQVTRGRVQVGDRVLEGDDLAVLALYPRPAAAGSGRALVGVVAGTGPAGLRLTERLPYFVSGVAYPDWIVIGPEMLQSGSAGVRAAGFFNNDWQLDPGQSAWR